MPLGVWRTTSRRVVGGGRSGEDAVSTIYWKPHDCPISKNPITLRDRELLAVRQYLENTELCRRRWLLDHFDAKVVKAVNQCCDVCSEVVEVVTNETGESGDSTDDEFQ